MRDVSAGAGWRAQKGNPDHSASHCSHQHCFSYLCWTLQLLGFPLENHILLLKAPNRRAASLGYCRESGPLCWVCAVVNTRLGTGDWEALFFFFFSLSFFLFHLLNPAGSGAEPAADIIRWIFEKNKSSSTILYTAGGEKTKRTPIKNRYSVCVCECVFIVPCPWYFS